MNGHMIFMIRRYPLNNSDVIWKSKNLHLCSSEGGGCGGGDQEQKRTFHAETDYGQYPADIPHRVNTESMFTQRQLQLQ